MGSKNYRVLDSQPLAYKCCKNLCDSLYKENVLQAENLITSLEGLNRLENLNLLHLRDNSLVKLDGFAETNGELAYVNLR